MKKKKTATNVERELRCWKVLFTTGYDFFHDLAALNIPAFQENHEAARLAAPEAWRRLGALFLRTWKPSTARDLPWALVEFGPPS